MSKFSTEQYEQIKPYFLEKEDGMDCARISRITGIGYGKVLACLSFYLRTVQIDSEMRENTCPSCGRLKSEVNDSAVCRDVIHFV